VHHTDGTGEKCERDDVPDIRRRIKPRRLADGRREIGLLERNEKRRGRIGHQRISYVLRSTVIRSARISSFWTVEGYPYAEMFCRTAAIFAVAPRPFMRDVGASVTVQTLSVVRTVIVACGFSNFEVMIGPVTVTGLLAS